MTKTCYNCGKATAKELFNYPICDSCKSKLKLFTEATIKKYYDKDPEGLAKEIQRRLDFIEIDYINKKIKLLSVKEKLWK
jgi:hypothetical protein